jgi:hypothetical protein
MRQVKNYLFTRQDAMDADRMDSRAEKGKTNKRREIWRKQTILGVSNTTVMHENNYTYIWKGLAARQRRGLIHRNPSSLSNLGKAFSRFNKSSPLEPSLLRPAHIFCVAKMQGHTWNADGFLHRTGSPRERKPWWSGELKKMEND